MSNEHQPGSPLYPRNLRAVDLEPHYCRHVSAMTTEQLHSKADIAEQLAWRDQAIEQLRARVGGLEAEARMWSETAEENEAAIRHLVSIIDRDGGQLQQGDPPVSAAARAGCSVHVLHDRAESAEARVKELEKRLRNTRDAWEEAHAAAGDRVNALESQLAAAREEQGLLKSFEAMLVKRNAEHERYVELRLSIGVSFGEVSWKASDGEEFGPLPTLPALLRAILEVEARS